MCTNSIQNNAAGSEAEKKEENLLSFEGLSALVVFNLIQTMNRLLPLLDRDLRELRISSSKLNVLLLLKQAEHEELSLSEIGKRLVVTKANITGLIDRLEERGLVKRESIQDRRVTIARLTPQGHELAEKILPGHEKLLDQITAGLTDEEKRTLVTMLVKLRRSLKDLLRSREQKKDTL